MKILKMLKERLLICISVILLILPLAGSGASVQAADMETRFHDIKATIDKQGQVTISGRISSGAGNEVTIQIQNPGGSTEYVNSVMSMTGGEFQCNYKLKSTVTGVYKVQISAIGRSLPATTSFVYGADSTLKELSLNYGTLSPGFSPEVTEYSATVNNKVKQLTLTAIVNDITSTAAVNDTRMNSGSFSQSIDLAEGENKIAVEVTALSGEKKIYRITVVRSATNAAALTAEAKIGKNRVVTVEGQVSTGEGQRVTLRIIDPSKKTEYVNDTLSGENGKYSFSYSMKNAAMGRYLVALGAEDISSRVETYFDYGTDANLLALTADKISFTPVFNSNTSIYFAKVSSRISSICFTPTASDESAGILVNGTQVLSGQESQQILLQDGENEVEITVTAANGRTEKTYRIMITKNQSVALEHKIEAKVDKSKRVTMKGYLQTGNYGEASIMVRDPKGKLDFINSADLSEGVFFSSYLLKNSEKGKYTVSVGAKDPDVIATTYFIFDPGNSELESLILNGANMFPEYDKTITEYYAYAEYGMAEVSVIPTAYSQNATIRVNQSLLSSGETSPGIALQVGDNLIDIEVTSEDGTMVTNYTVHVNRQSKPAVINIPTPIPTPNPPEEPQLSNDAALGSLSVTAAGDTAEVRDPLIYASDLGFTPDYLYDITDHNITTADITLTANDINALEVTINGDAVVSGTPVNKSIVPEGDGWFTVFEIVITAQDGVTKRTYSLVIVPAPNPT